MIGYPVDKGKLKIRISKLHEAGLTYQEIANELMLSITTVAKYHPMKGVRKNESIHSKQISS